MTGFLAYARQVIGEDDIEAVAQVLRGEWLTTGPTVKAFEAALAQKVGAKHAIVCNSGTAALYIAARAAGLQPGDTVIVPSVTFLATASANVLAGIHVVFADVDPDTGLMSVTHAQDAFRRSHGKARAIYPVHLGGRVDNPGALYAFAQANGMMVIEDACHALGTTYGNEANTVGSCRHSVAACFSFHPAKTIAMGEGGAVTTNSDAIAHEARLVCNHGMTRAPDEFANQQLAFAGGVPNPWYYEAGEISHNFRASDINCALGLSQLKKLDGFVAARRALMAHYERKLARLTPTVRFVGATPGDAIGWHICQVLVDFSKHDRRTVMERLKNNGIGTQVHYIPVHMQPYYRANYPTPDLPGSRQFYDRTLSLPLFPSMTEEDVGRVVEALAASLGI